MAVFYMAVIQMDDSQMAENIIKCNKVFISVLLVSMSCLSSYVMYQSCHVRLGLSR